jgi:uncharacterized delta-60 repeat protein
VSNSATQDGGGIYCQDYSTCTLNNAVLWVNSAPLGNQIYTYDSTSRVALNYCDFANGVNDVMGTGTVTKNNCIYEAPQFADAANGNYRLQAASPCIDRGNNSYVPAGVTTDLDGNPRIVDGDDDGIATVDIGAYEFIPPPPWAKTYGGTDYDYAYSIYQTSDGGYIVAGITYSFGAGGWDFWVLKLNSDGAVAWQKSYGGVNHDYAYSIQQTIDGGYIVAGLTYSSGAGNDDSWVLKLTSDGSVSWQKTYGGTSYEETDSIQQTSDGGYIVAGRTKSFGAGGWDIWVLKLNSDGTVAWQKRYGGVNDDGEYLIAIQQTSDGGYIVAGYTDSFGAGGGDIWVLKLNSNGSVSWQKTYGGTSLDFAWSIQQTSDGGYIVAGRAGSFGAGSNDFWVLKLNSNGTVLWQKTYGGPNDEFANSIQQTSDGGYIVAGLTQSFGAGGSDLWVLKLNSDGTVCWQKTYGGTSGDIANSIYQTSDGRYVVAGHTNSFGAGLTDFWVLKLNSDGTIPFNPASGAQMIDTSVVPANTSATVTNTAVTGVNTSATVTNTSATVTDTDATIYQQAP